MRMKGRKPMKTYETPEAEFLVVTCSDIIMTSGDKPPIDVTEPDVEE